jgi:hypothetical protein
VSAAPTLAAEDAKLVTLARSARARLGRPEGAAVRDGDGRTYAAATVALPSLRLSAIQAAVAAAVSSGAATLEAAVVVTEAEQLVDEDLAVVRDLAGPGCPVHRVGPDAALRESVTAGSGR